jgi:hypothetical protein
MAWLVEFYIDPDGNEPVKDFILARSKGTIAEILHVFKLLREFNIGLGMPYVKKIDKSGLRELRIKHGPISIEFSFLLILVRNSFSCMPL